MAHVMYTLRELIDAEELGRKSMVTDRDREAKQMDAMYAPCRKLWQVMFIGGMYSAGIIWDEAMALSHTLPPTRRERTEDDG